MKRTQVSYTYTIQAGLPKSSIVPLQRVQKTAARLIRALGPRVHVTSTLRDLQWLPSEQRIISNCVGSLTHLVISGHSPRYLQELVTLTSDIASRSRIGSASSRRYETPMTRLKIGAGFFSFVVVNTAQSAGPIPYHVFITPGVVEATHHDCSLAKGQAKE